MTEQILEVLKQAMIGQKSKIIDVSSNLSEYKKKTDLQLSAIMDAERLRGDFVNERVDKYLKSIPLPKDADNDYIVNELKKNITEEYILSDLKKDVNSVLDELLKTNDNKIENLDKEIADIINNKMHSSQEYFAKVMRLSIESQVSRIPKPANGKDGRDGKNGRDGKKGDTPNIDYSLVEKEIQKEVNKKEYVEDVEVIRDRDGAFLKIFYSNKKTKKLELPVNTRTTVIGGGGSESTNICELPLAENILDTDNIELCRDGEKFKTTASDLNKNNVGEDDVEITDFTKGVVLHDSEDKRWRITVETDGSLRTTKILDI